MSLPPSKKAKRFAFWFYYTTSYLIRQDIFMITY